MNELTNHALTAIESYRNNKVIMDFVTNEALEKVAAELNKRDGITVTTKAVDYLMLNKRHASIKARFDKYVELGLIGCYMAYLKDAH